MQTTSKTKFETVDDYISALPPNVRVILEDVRNAIQQAAPQAEEVISYSMPAFKLNGIVVWYAACKEHIGFYPSSSPIKVFKKELLNYKTSKGAIQFPMKQEIPKALIKKIVKFRIEENLAKAMAMAKKKKKG